MTHLDLKPANIFVDALGMLKIGDFGLSARIGESHDADSEGDKVYMAPEVLEGHYSKAADIFSLGLIALELAADVVLPSEGDSWTALRRGDFGMLNLDDISPDLSSLITAMLSAHPSERPTAEQVISCVGQRYQRDTVAAM